MKDGFKYIEKHRQTFVVPVFPTHVFLSEVDEVLQINVIPVRTDVVVDEQVELVLDPVLKDKGQHACGQLQEEDDSQEHRKLRQESRRK